MLYYDCLLTSPVCIKNKYNSFIHPIIFSRNLYVIQESKLNAILIELDYYKDFILSIRTYGYSYVKNWLKSKNLLNEAFLESISQFFIKNTSFKAHSNFNQFIRKNNNPIIDNEYWDSNFKSGILFNYISEHSNEFNQTISDQISIIENELSHINDISLYNMRKDYLKLNIFNYLINSFTEKHSESIEEEFQKIDNLNIFVELISVIDNLSLNKVAGLSNYKNSKFQFSKSSYDECLDAGSIIRINISLRGRYSYVNYLDNLFDNLEKFAKAKLNFDVNFISKIFLEKNITSNIEYKHVRYPLENTSFLEMKEKSSKTTALKDINFSVSDTIKIQNLHHNFILNKFEINKSSNLILHSVNELEKIICLLLMNQDNISRITNLLFTKNHNLESEIVNVCFDSSKFIKSFYGYANLIR